MLNIVNTTPRLMLSTIHWISMFSIQFFLNIKLWFLGYFDWTFSVTPVLLFDYLGCAYDRFWIPHYCFLVKSIVSVISLRCLWLFREAVVLLSDYLICACDRFWIIHYCFWLPRLWVRLLEDAPVVLSIISVVRTIFTKYPTIAV